MAITAKQSGETREPVPAGNYLGVVVGVYDLGTQEGGQYGPKHQVLLQFELHGKKGVKLDKNNRPLLISKFYNLAFGEKADLRADTEAILNRSFTDEEAKEGYDVTQLLDQACRLNVKHEKRKDGKGVTDNISSITPLDEDDPDLEPQSNAIAYELDPGGSFPEGMPEWIQNKVKKSKEWAESEGSSRSSAPARSGGNGRQAARGAGRQTTATAARGGSRQTAGVATKSGDDDDDSDIPF